MAVSRSLREERLMSSLLSNKALQFLLVFLSVSSVILFYNFAGTRESFLTETKSIKASMHVDGNSPDKKSDQAAKHAEEYENDFHILFMFTNVDQHRELADKLETVLSSLFSYAEFNPYEILHLHFVSDTQSESVARKKLEVHRSNPKLHLQTHFHDVDSYAKQVYPIVKSMQEHFGNHAYYKDAIFFLSVAMHRILPANIHRIVQLDLDLKISCNIRDLWEEFSYFKHTNIYGLARENQPVYRHTFWKHRKDNPATRVGEPPPNGITGFNSGVILLHLDKIRESKPYNEFLDSGEVKDLAEKYHFKGHLGDQDFFTLMSIDHEDLFYVLDCTWNRQLCQWWKSRGYEDVFDRYFMCNGDIKIWHGNCNTPFPADSGAGK